MELTTVKELEEYFGDPEYRSMGMSKVQMENFIFSMQITSTKVAFQFINELQTRFNSLKGSILHVEEKEAERMILEEEKEVAKTAGKVQLKKVLIKLKDHEIRMTKVKINQSEKEINYIISSLNKYELATGNKLTEMDFENEEDDREYWMKRLSKQAGLDIVSNGRISTGNMEALMVLPGTDSDKVLSNAIAISLSLRADMEHKEKTMLAHATEKELEEKKKYLLGSQLQNGNMLLEE